MRNSIKKEISCASDVEGDILEKEKWRKPEEAMSISDGDAVLTPIKEGEEEKVWLGRVSDCRTIQGGIRQVDGKFLSQSCMSKEPHIW